MRYSFLIPALFAASAVAAPAVEYVTKVDVVHMVVHKTVTAGTPEATAAANYVQEGSADNSGSYFQHPHQKKPEHSHHSKPKSSKDAVKVVVQTYKPSPAPKPAVTTYKAAPAPTTYAAAPAPTKPSSSSSSDSGIVKSDGESVLEIANKWRGIFGKPEFKWDDTLAANALETASNGHGVDQNHILPTLSPGQACGQVITPGFNHQKSSFVGKPAFEVALLGGWLCEMPSDSHISSICSAMAEANASDHSNGDTAHYEDFLNGDFTKIGCAFSPKATPDMVSDGLWVCSFYS